MTTATVELGATASTTFTAMGSTVHVAVVGSVPDMGRVVQDRLVSLERVWSRFDPTSELSMLNASAGLGPRAASAELMAGVDASLQLWRATDGWFDPTTIAALEWSGYDRTFVDVRGGAVRHAGVPCPIVPSPVGVVVDHERGTITVPQGVRLDLGGVGKGLAADIVAAELVLLGAESACVSVGGDVAVAGVHPDGSWRVPVTDPSHGDRIGWEVPLAQGAIVQSSRVVRSWSVGNEQRNHLINPRTGSCANAGIVAAVVCADRAWWAEGIAKAAVLAGAVEGASLVRRLARGGWLIRDDGAVVLAGEFERGVRA